MRIFLPVLFFFYLSAFSQQESPYSIYLIGDAGKDTIPGKALQFLGQKVLQDSASTILFLGDNIYPDGLILDSSKAGFLSQKKLLSQLSVLENYKGNTFFVPGNHDWSSGKLNGNTRIEDQQRFISNRSATIHFATLEGTPGPVQVKLANQNINLIFIDTQWFLHQRFLKKVNTYPGLTYKQTKEKCFKDLDSLLQEAKLNHKKVIIAAHHPLLTNGRHSKKRAVMRFINNYTPVQLIGIFVTNRFFVQDIYQPAYNRMRKQFLTILSNYNNVIYVCGHDHNLEYIKQDQLHEIISGAGSKLADFNPRQPFPSNFQHNKELGFFKLHFLSTGEIEIEAWGAESKSLLYKTSIHLP